jgi:hypothetical protein
LITAMIVVLYLASPPLNLATDVTDVGRLLVGLSHRDEDGAEDSAIVRGGKC